MADEELKKAFTELQFKTNESRQKIAQGEVLKKVTYQKKRIAEVTSGALTDISNELPVYRSVGRMFVLSDKTSEIDRYQIEAKELSDKMETIDKQKVYLEKAMQEAEQNVREMVESRRS